MPEPTPHPTRDLVTDILVYIANFVGSILSQIAGYTNNLVLSLANYMGSLLQQLTGWLSQQLAGLINWFSSLLNSVFAYLNTVFETIGNYIIELFANLGQVLNSVFTQIGASINSMVTAISNAMQNILNRLSNVIEDIWEAMASAISNVIDTVAGWINQTAANIAAMLDQIVDTVVSWIQSAINTITSFVSDVVEFITGLVNAAKQAVTNVVTYIFDLVIQTIQQVTAVVQAAWEQLVTGAEAIITSVNERIGDLSGAFTQAATDLIAQLGEISDEALGPIREAISKITEQFGSWIDQPTINALSAVTSQLASPTTFAVQDRAQAYQVFQRLQPNSPWQRFLYHLVFSVGMAIRLYSGIADANAAIILQEHGAFYPYQILSPADIVAAWQKSQLPTGDAVNILKRHGYSEGTANRLLNSSTATPPVGDLVAMHLRELLSDEGLNRGLRANGLTEEWFGLIKAMGQQIPSPADLVSMAVREAFSPDVIQRFGMLEDFPPAFARYAKLQGISEEWAQRYWAAHWDLPSATQGFEMLHRDVIGWDDMNLLLRSLDVMPYWREKLAQIAYSTYTRVDIRRMHQLGILNEDQVYKAHKELGYDDDKARNLTGFVIKLNAHKPAESDAELGDLSRSSILNFYKDGLLSAQRAIELLITLGYTPEGARLYVSSADLDLQRKDRQLELATVLDLFKAGELTFEAAQDRLADAGFEEREIQRAFAQLRRTQAANIKLPDQALGAKMFESRVIDKPTYTDLLLKLGYSARWAERIVKLAEAARG